MPPLPALPPLPHKRFTITSTIEVVKRGVQYGVYGQLSSTVVLSSFIFHHTEHTASTSWLFASASSNRKNYYCKNNSHRHIAPAAAGGRKKCDWKYCTSNELCAERSWSWRKIQVEFNPKQLLWGTLSSLVTFVYATISLSTKIATLHILTTPHNKYLIYYFAMH